jgi:hypothetical protein
MVAALRMKQPCDRPRFINGILSSCLPEDEEDLKARLEQNALLMTELRVAGVWPDGGK